MKTENFLNWCKKHPRLSTLMALFATVLILALVFCLSGLIFGMVKHPTLYHVIFFGFWSCLWCILAIKANHGFQKWLLIR